MTSRRAWLGTVAGMLLAAVYIVPVYWMVATSLKEPGDIFAVPPALVPSPITVSPATASFVATSFALAAPTRRAQNEVRMRARG